MTRLGLCCGPDETPTGRPVPRKIDSGVIPAPLLSSIADERL